MRIKNALAWIWVEDLYITSFYDFDLGKITDCSLKIAKENYEYITELVGCELKYSWIHLWEKLMI